MNSIRLYTLLHCAACDDTRAALTARDIAFTERSAVDKAPGIVPVVTALVEGGIVAWSGHRPDMIDLLADLLNDGPVPPHGLRDLEAAENTVLTRQQVLDQVEQHQLNPQDFLDECGDAPLYRGAALLDWLGY